MIKRALFTSVVLCILLPFVGHAQDFRSVRWNRDLLIHAGIGTATYFGEITGSGDFGKINPSAVIGAEYFFTKRISVRGQFAWFRTSGDDADAKGGDDEDSRRLRNLSFASSNFEFSAMGVISLVPQGFRFEDRPRVNIHAFAGIGVMRFNPTTEYQGERYKLQPIQTEGVSYSRVTPVIPFGLGARIKLNPFYNLLIEGGYRFTFTDYMDDVSVRRYPDPATLQSDLARALSDRRAEFRPPTTIGTRGNPKTNDGYFLINVSLQYYIPFEVNKNPQKKLYNRDKYMRKKCKLKN
jgi:hypothetical protein